MGNRAKNEGEGVLVEWNEQGTKDKGTKDILPSIHCLSYLPLCLPFPLPSTFRFCSSQ